MIISQIRWVRNSHHDEEARACVCVCTRNLPVYHVVTLDVVLFFFPRNTEGGGEQMPLDCSIYIYIYSTYCREKKDYVLKID